MLFFQCKNKERYQQPVPSPDLQGETVPFEPKESGENTGEHFITCSQHHDGSNMRLGKKGVASSACGQRAQPQTTWFHNVPQGGAQKLF